MTGTSKFDNLAAEATRRRKETSSALEEMTEGRAEQPARRRSGKRNDPLFTQVTAYIPKDLHKRVKVALLEGEEEKEFSLLVEELLDGWMRRRKESDKTA